MKKDIQRKLAEIQAQQDIQNFSSSLNRARSVTVGTCFGGTTELMMRGNDGSVLWCPMQPVEVIELIHQLAANVGCHIALKPRDDFSSWREWRVSEAEKKHLNGHPPFVNDMAVFQRLGASGFNQQEAEKIVTAVLAQKENLNDITEVFKKGRNHDQTMATKKAVNRRSAKRAAAPA